MIKEDFLKDHWNYFHAFFKNFSRTIKIKFWEFYKIISRYIRNMITYGRKYFPRISKYIFFKEYGGFQKPSDIQLAFFKDTSFRSVLPGYEGDLLSAIFNECVPNTTYYLYGVPHWPKNWGLVYETMVVIANCDIENNSNRIRFPKNTGTHTSPWHIINCDEKSYLVLAQIL